MSVRLRPLTDDEFELFLKTSNRDYADDLVVNGGMPRPDAEAKSERDYASLFPGGVPNDEQFVFAIENLETGERSGWVWFAIRDNAAFLYWIKIEERLRGQGLGRAAMVTLEDEVRSRGFDRINLNVFGGNEVARSLYRSLGYTETSVWMGKSLDVHDS